MARRKSIDELPEDVRKWLEKVLKDNNFNGYKLLEDALREKGFTISKSAIHRYGQKLERHLAAIKAGTQASKIVMEVAGDDEDARSEALIALVQTAMFECLVNLQEATDPDTDPAERIKLLSKVAIHIAPLTRASVNVKRFQVETRARVEAAAANVEKIATKGGLSAESVNLIRNEVLGIAA